MAIASEVYASDGEGSSAFSGAEDEAELAPFFGGTSRRADRENIARRRSVFIGTGVAMVLSVAAACAAWTVAGSSSPAQAPLTVRSLLVSPELTDVATDNLIALGGDDVARLGRGAVHQHVTRRLQSISQEMEDRCPEDVEEMGRLELTEAQRDSVLHVLARFGDKRMSSLAADLADAMRENVHEGGDRASFKRRLSEKLAPRWREMQELSEEMYPGRKFEIDLERLGPVANFDKWHPKIEIDMAEPSETELPGRRLGDASGFDESTDEEVDGGVRAQTATLLQVLHGHLGDKMPRAPARMLSFFDSSSDPSNSGSSSGSSNGGGFSFGGGQSSGSNGGSQHHESKLSFMDCMMKAMPNPMAVAECISDNINEVFQMMLKYVQGGGNA